jgi:DNA-binding PadR family transcriptional regulator
MIIKGHSRDTAWYSITEEEWPLVKRALEAWLDDGNFDTSGKQIKGLRELREAFKVNTS